jgi:hypothetical protein
MAKPITTSQNAMSGATPDMVLVNPKTPITTIITETHQVIIFGALGFIILLHFKLGYGNEALSIHRDFGYFAQICRFEGHSDNYSIEKYQLQYLLYNCFSETSS